MSFFFNACLNCIVVQSLDGRSIRVDEAGKGSRRQSGGQYAGRGGGRFGGGSRGRGELERCSVEKTAVKFNSYVSESFAFICHCHALHIGGGYDRGYGERYDRGCGERGERGYTGYRSGSGGGGGGGGGYSSYRDSG